MMAERANESGQIVIPQGKQAHMIAGRALATGFTYPSAAWVTDREQWGQALMEALETLGLPVDGLAEALDALPSDPGATLETLQVEYTYLFINGVPSVPAPPYASAYTGEGLLMGEPAGRALRAYREAGLALDASRHELPDHLAAELEFLFYLLREEALAHAANDAERAAVFCQRSAAFLSEHLLPWVPTWRERVEQAARLAFYRELARSTEGWLQAAVKPDATH